MCEEMQRGYLRTCGLFSYSQHFSPHPCSFCKVKWKETQGPGMERGHLHLLAWSDPQGPFWLSSLPLSRLDQLQGLESGWEAATLLQTAFLL